MNSKEITIASTRFNNYTWNENVNYRKKLHYDGCIYGCPQAISSKIPEDSILYIFEMNNSLNRIEGIGLIKNKIFYDYYYKIYSDGNYNRFVYRSSYRVNRDYLESNYPDILSLFELILFKGKTHLKRGFGITTVPDKLIDKYYSQIYSRDQEINFENSENKKIDIIKRRLNTIFKKYNNRE